VYKTKFLHVRHATKVRKAAALAEQRAAFLREQRQQYARGRCRATIVLRDASTLAWTCDQLSSNFT
jgi:ribosomal protein L37AE/L43A